MTRIYYAVRGAWFRLFPRKVGLKGFLPAPSNLKAAAPMPKSPPTWKAPRLKWGMLGNDTYGDCVVAGLCHAVMAVGDFLGLKESFSAPEATDAYFSMTGGADVGLNPTGVLEEWQANTEPEAAQVLFGRGGPFVTLDPTNTEQLKEAITAFGWVGVGANLQQAQENQFANGQRWNYVPGSKVVGGHFVVLLGYDKGNVGPYTVTWGKGIRATWEWVNKCCVEAYTGVLPPTLSAGKYVAPVSTLDSYVSNLPGV